MYQKDRYTDKKEDEIVKEREENHEEACEEEGSFWKKLSKLFYSLAMFNAINKHY